ncbi:hypothetical protein BDN71DRAFT_1457448 [Pleurotus eryngii]|uniref:Uncharacterized protein n=1 Tax=Pleurotus eryngii TaxID=5323 RepID=A0A9P5ZIH9_PLEER|nr:hypothetical protein BDN71DRAFT_1457448 [Pleurotus eryngii]
MKFTPSESCMDYKLPGSWNDSKLPSLCLAMAMVYVQHYLTSHYPATHPCVTPGTTPNTAQP